MSKNSSFDSVVASASMAPTELGTGEAAPPTHYRTVQVGGLSIFYREAGNPEAPTLLLMHGFPSSSRMYEPLLTRLGSRYHLIAPDYPGFGHSDAPSADSFEYTFDHLSKVMLDFTDELGIKEYTLYLQDYGGPVGMRMAIARPVRLRGLIIQNAATHEEALGPLWKSRREFWDDRAANEEKLRSGFLSLFTTRQRHIGSNPAPDTIDPDRWTDEFAFLCRPGQADIQSNLFYDYRTNVSSYPAWGAWLREHRPRTLVVWGRYDPSFLVDEVDAIKRDVPDAELHVLDAGHFALYERPEEVARWVSAFMDRLRGPGALEVVAA